MDTSKQNSDTIKTDVKNLWIDRSRNSEYQSHATIFSTDATTESVEIIAIFKKVNIMDLEKRKELYGVCGECNEPEVVLVKFIWLTGPKERLNIGILKIKNGNDFLNEINYYISGHVHATNTVMCFGITQDPNTKDYMMVLEYCDGGNLRNTLRKGFDYNIKMKFLFCIIDGLLVIWECVNQPKISEDTPKLIIDLIIKCWNAKAENRPTAKELRQILEKYLVDVYDDEPVNSTDYLSSYQENVSSSSANPISECLDCELNELDLNQDDDE
ncbi:kinase-like domain-containing protein [Rhizophagus irregularis DAOM 181602=DAOM 197198]|nr:kinase-like domain-containing protein [Rhizophagus irregularis DAOM 181602=DAOM 197198]